MREPLLGAHVRRHSRRTSIRGRPTILVSSSRFHEAFILALSRRSFRQLSSLFVFLERLSVESKHLKIFAQQPLSRGGFGRHQFDLESFPERAYRERFNHVDVLVLANNIFHAHDFVRFEHRFCRRFEFHFRRRRLRFDHLHHRDAQDGEEKGRRTLSLSSSRRHRTTHRRRKQ